MDLLEILLAFLNWPKNFMVNVKFIIIAIQFRLVNSLETQSEVVNTVCIDVFLKVITRLTNEVSKHS